MKIHEYFFEHGHLCLVCELMGEDLRSYVRKHQNTVTLDEIKKYAICMFMSLYELRKNSIIHADIKPDNFLFTNDHSKVKLCDFGTSYKVDEHTSEIEYLVARYYRAPEIMLGYDTSPDNRYHIDTWAVACSLFELYTGEFLFNGSTNN
jgi:serine/threonine-protein kinase PRP4